MFRAILAYFKIGWPSVGLVFALAIIFELTAYGVWSLGIKRYSSASS